MENQRTINVPVSWFEGLIKAAKSVEDSKPAKYKKYVPFLHQHLAGLLGYIESAKIIIK